MKRTELIAELYQLAADLPPELAEKVALILREAVPGKWNEIRRQALETVSQPNLRRAILYLLNYWQTYTPDVSPESLALALQAIAYAEDRHRRSQSLELVWTGPDTQVIPLRRTDQVLLQLIREAREELHVVSFAVYKATAVSQALVEAARRGVCIAIYLETPDAGESKITYDTVKALGQEVTDQARLYTWPLDQRPLSGSGKHGSLHAKLAVADGRAVFISSANLTEYAMTLNMELGVLINGGALPGQVQAHLTRLIEKGIFRPV